MLAEALKHLQGLAQQAAAPKPEYTRPPGWPPNKIVLIDAERGVNDVDVPAPPLKLGANSLSGFADLVARYKLPPPADPVLVGGTQQRATAVFANHTSVTAVLGAVAGEHRLDRIGFRLTHADQYTALFDENDGKAGAYISQLDMIDLLKNGLAGIPEAQALLRIVRNIKMSSDRDGTSEIASGMASLSSAVRKELLSRGGEPIPEQVTFWMPVYNELVNERWPIRLAFDIDLDDFSMRLLPLAGEAYSLRLTADMEVINQLRNMLAERGCEDVPIFNGSCD